ncbi:MAG: hypothetical protein JST19_06630 [Bacteroidetes bacterium]|nr:hypothetical protein [Bacteroidota bacterium]
MEEQNLSAEQKDLTPEQKNLKALQDNLYYAGFGSLLNKALEERFNEQLPEFKLSHQAKIGEKEMDYELNFKKGDKLYFFKGFEATLKKPGENEDGLRQYFYANQNITANEAYNLLDGRAVNKTYHIYEKVDEDGKEKYQRTDQTYNTWLQLDFIKQKDDKNNFQIQKYGEKYGFDLEAKMKKLAIAEMNDPEKASRLISLLKKGNLQDATLEKDGTQQKVYLAANPINRNIIGYDANGSRMEDKELQVSKKSKEHVTENAQKKSERQAETLEAGPKQGRGHKI